MTSRKPCINVSNAFYSGKEQSPLHFGLSAEGYELNTVLEGYDRMIWAVKMKNNRKVWVRQMPVSGHIRMVHEEPVVPETQEDVSIQQDTQPDVQPTIQEELQEEQEPPKKPDVIKPIVEEKKLTDYNLFLTYRLHELKKQNHDKTNKELFNSAIAEWKELKKNPIEFKNVMQLAKAFEKPNSK
jgi:hypothetical protein